MGNSRFPKEEKLTKKRAIEALFKKGTSFTSFPFKIIYEVATQGALLHQVLISVPTRNFKRAVDRNTIKRRIREGYRLNKSTLTTSTKFCLAYIYIAKEILPSSTIHQAMQISLKRLNGNESKK